MPTSALTQTDSTISDEDRFRHSGPLRRSVDEDANGVYPQPSRREPLPELAANDSAMAFTECAQEEPQEIVGPLIRYRMRTARNRRFRVLQEWEGVVNEVTAGTVWANLRDVSSPGGPMEIVQFSLEEIAKTDRPLLETGSAFYWTIGYETSPAGQRTRVSEIRMRRVPRWSQNQIDEMKRKAALSFERFGANGGSESSTTA